MDQVSTDEHAGESHGENGAQTRHQQDSVLRRLEHGASFKLMYRAECEVAPPNKISSCARAAQQ